MISTMSASLRETITLPPPYRAANPSHWPSSLMQKIRTKTKDVFRKIAHFFKLLFSNEYRLHCYRYHHEAATTIQKVVRGHFARKRYKEEKENREIFLCLEQAEKDAYQVQISLRTKRQLIRAKKHELEQSQQNINELLKSKKLKSVKRAQLQRQASTIASQLNGLEHTLPHIKEQLQERERLIARVRCIVQKMQGSSPVTGEIEEACIPAAAENTPLPVMEQYLQTIKELFHPRMEEAYRALFEKFPPDNFLSWRSIGLNTYALKLKKPARVWIPSARDTRIKGGVIMNFDRLIRFQFDPEQKTLYCLSGIHNMTYLKVFFTTTGVEPDLKRIIFTDEGQIDFFVKAAGLVEKRSRTSFAELFNEWSVKSEAVQGDPWEFLDKKCEVN